MRLRVTVEWIVDLPGPAVRADLLDQVEAWCVFATEVEGHSRRHAEQAARWARAWVVYMRDNNMHTTPDSCVAWLRDMTRGASLSPQTIRNRASACRRFAGWMVVQGVLDANPWTSVPMPRGRARQGADAFTDDQVAALIAHAERMATKGRKPSDRASAANRANLYRFLSLTGLRRGEARAQRWDDIDLKARTMVISLDKARRSDPVPLSVAAAGMLRQLLAQRGTSPLVFPTIVTDKALEADCRACGITGRGKWHRFRVGFVTESFEAGVPPELIQRLVRHRSIDQTHRYLRHRESRLRDAVEARVRKKSADSLRSSETPDRLPVDSHMGHGATISESMKTTSQVAAPYGSESTLSLAGLLSALGRSGLVTSANEKARVRGREPFVSRGDRIWTDTPTDVGPERLIHHAMLLMQLAMLQMQQGAASEQVAIRADGRGHRPSDSGTA